ncbi:MAG TPA: peptide-methionine (S)-S-oxide reductase MsrA [Dermatophilaceae bacterium]|nr:peptide-methionine (S)-S-oxide reductase MsrA [Dermatophilaceae bacterium]
MSLFSRPKTSMPSREQALSGRPSRPYAVPATHEVLGTPLEGPWADGTEVLYVAMGCFWGVERIFWRLPGVVSTAAGYQGGLTPNPTYEETCTGLTGHAETVLVAYDPARTTPELLLKAFWENHDPTQGNRQGNDVGTAYRSAVYWTTPEQEAAARATRAAFEEVLRAAGRGTITTELRPASEAGPFYWAEGYHQQYLHKNPGGYCNHGPNGLTCPVGVANLPAQQDIAPPT